MTNFIDGHVCWNNRRLPAYRLPTKEDKHPFSVSIYSKQTEVCHFRFLFAENKRKLPFLLVQFSCLRNSGNVETWTWRHGSMDMVTSNRKRKPRQFSLTRLPFSFCANGSLLFVCPFVDKETNVSYPSANGLNELAHLCLNYYPPPISPIRVL
jgi:hypothetical protein